MTKTPNIPPCSAPIIVDAQMEIVLSTIMVKQLSEGGRDIMSPSRLSTVRILDLGCGDGKLLRKLWYTSSMQLSWIDYTGMDLDSSQLSKAKSYAEAKSKDFPKTSPLVHWLSSCSFGGPSILMKLLNQDRYIKTRDDLYDVIVVVNVFHHIDPINDLPSFICGALNSLSQNGYLIICDSFLGDYSNALSLMGCQCHDSTWYTGPGELAAIVGFVCGNPSTRFYEEIEDDGIEKQHYHTTLIRNSNRVMSTNYCENYEPGIHYSLVQSRDRSLAAASNEKLDKYKRKWFENYSQKLENYILNSKYHSERIPTKYDVIGYTLSPNNLEYDYYTGDPFRDDSKLRVT